MLLLSMSSSETKGIMGEEDLWCIIEGSGYIDCQKCRFILYKIFAVIEYHQVRAPGATHYSLIHMFNSGHQNPMATAICGECLLPSDKLTLLSHDI